MHTIVFRAGGLCVCGYEQRRAMGEEQSLNPFERLGRTVEFWRRATGIYLGYKVTQVRRRALSESSAPHVQPSRG